MTVCIESKEAWRSIQNQLGDLRIGLVPTMGALHEGHRSLLERSVRENDITVLTVFVNPTQFNESQDLEAYPRRLEEDRQIAQACGVHYLFAPSVEEMYGANEHFRMTEHHFSHGMEGAHRPGHFDGVLTIVLKLLNLIQADRAYFGEKDYQQYQLVSEMAKAFFLKTEIVPCPIVRAASGLALSSRNLNLSPEELDRAPELYKALSDQSQDCADVTRTLGEKGFDVEYVEEKEGRRYCAAWLGRVRLIDNVAI